MSAVVTNTGRRAGAAVAQVYVGRPASTVARAPRELKAFERVELAPGEARRVELPLTRRDLSHWDVGVHRWTVEPGALTVQVGASSRDLPLSTTVPVDAAVERAPLTLESTVTEWMQHPTAGPALLEALGEHGALFSADGDDPALAAFLTAMPVGKIPVMGMAGDDLTAETLERLLEAHCATA